MEQFCNSLHPHFGVGQICAYWFRHAVDHCFEIIFDRPHNTFFTAMKKLVLPSRPSFFDQIEPINKPPYELSMDDCQTLFQDIFNDYLLRRPQEISAAVLSEELWRIIYALIALIGCVLFLVMCKWAYHKCHKRRNSLQVIDDIQDVLVQNYIDRNIRIVKYEIRRLKVRHSVQLQDLLCSDGTPTFVVEVLPNFSSICGIISSNTQGQGSLIRTQNLQRKNNTSAYETVTKVEIMSFLSKYSCKMRLLLVSDEDSKYDRMIRFRHASNPITSNLIRKTPTTTDQVKPTKKKAKTTPIKIRRRLYSGWRSSQKSSRKN